MAEHTTNGPAIYSKIASIISELGAIEKGKTNKDRGFKYRGIDDVYNAIHPLFAKHGVFTVPEVLERNQQEHLTKAGAAWKHVILKIKYTFYASDGSSITAIINSEGLDDGDKATNKALAIAHKYVMFQVFCIATEDIDDADATSAPAQAQRQQAAPSGNGHDAADKAYREAFSERFNWFKSFKAEQQVYTILGAAGYTKASEVPADKRASFLKALDDAKAAVKAMLAEKEPVVAEVVETFDAVPVDSSAVPPAPQEELGF